MAGEEKKKRGGLTRQQKVLIAIVIVLAAAVAVVAACKSLFVRPTLPGEKNEPDSQKEEIDYGEGTRPRADGERKSEDYYTILVLGRDTGGGGNTDTMLLASYDVTNQKATVMSIPRDTMVNVSWDVKKINSVYNTYGGGDKGIQAVYKEVAQLVGFEPDYRVVVEWEAVGELVDAIGGVYFDVPYDMNYHDPYQDLVIEQAKGYRLLTGEDAMQVIRWRKNDGSSGIGDSGRMEIQQDFLKAVIQQLLKPANVLNIGKIAKVFQNNVETDLSFQEILWFGQKAVSGGLSVDNVEFLTMPWKGVSAWSRSYHQKLSYVVPIAGELLEIVNSKLSPFVEEFTLSDLDIMYVNADGSIGSTTGHVEDTKATAPPVIPADTPEPTDPDEEEFGPGEVEIDPETGEPIDSGNTGTEGGSETPGDPAGSGTTEPSGGAGEGTGNSGSSGNTGGSSGNSDSGSTGGAGTPEPRPEPQPEPEPEPPAEPDSGFEGGVDWTTVPPEPNAG